MMARGDRGEPIYRDDPDRETFLATLADACEKTGWVVHAYVLMGNHYHLLLETPEPNLVAGMKWLQGTYTRRFNGRHAGFGHLFQGRYRALVVDGQEGSYFGDVSTYIHLNPARAGLTAKQPLRSYRWSSFPEYLKAPAARVTWLETARVLGSVLAGPDDDLSRRGYEAYLEGKVLELDSSARRTELEAQWKEIRKGWCLGGERFKEGMLERVDRVMTRHRRVSYAGADSEAHGERRADALLAAGLRVMGVARESLPTMAKGAAENRVLAWWLRRQTTVSRRWISERLYMGEESRVTHGARELERTTDPKLTDWKELLARAETPATPGVVFEDREFLD